MRRPKPSTPPLAGFPAISVIGRGDSFYQYASLLHHVYDRLECFEHDGGHAPPSSKELHAEIAAAIWKALGYAV